MFEIICGDVRDVLKDFPDNYFHVVCCSPPYWSLRDYSVEPSVWGGDSACQHVWGDERKVKYEMDYSFWKTGGVKRSDTDSVKSQGQYCQRCGAYRGQLGLEGNPDCGRPLLDLRDDLTVKECEYVVSELKKCKLI